MCLNYIKIRRLTDFEARNLRNVRYCTKKSARITRCYFKTDLNRRWSELPARLAGRSLGRSKHHTTAYAAPLCPAKKRKYFRHEELATTTLTHYYLYCLGSSTFDVASNRAAAYIYSFPPLVGRNKEHYRIHFPWKWMVKIFKNLYYDSWSKKMYFSNH